MHAQSMVEVDSALAGDIVAVFGLDCATGTTFYGQPNVPIGMVGEGARMRRKVRVTAGEYVRTGAGCVDVD